jgi:hypothetical protein
MVNRGSFWLLEEVVAARERPWLRREPEGLRAYARK